MEETYFKLGFFEEPFAGQTTDLAQCILLGHAELD